MDAETPETVKKPHPRHDAMRFLKQNLPEGNTASTEKESACAGNESSESIRPRAAHQMALTRFGEELAPDAAIWKVYLEETQKYGRELVEGRQRSLDTLLLFAVLFSVIITAFLFVSKDLLRQDPADASVALLRVIADSQLRMELGIHASMHSVEVAATIPEFTPSTAALWANGVWFVSLGLSLSAALIAMMGKEWLTALPTPSSQAACSVAFIQTSISRIKGLEDWGALRIIDLLPTLLQVSLLLFSAGFAIYLWALDAALAVVLTGVIGAMFAFYFMASILGATREFCPFVTEVSRTVKWTSTRLFGTPTAGPGTESVVPSIEELKAIVWLSQRTVDPMVVDSAYQAIAGLHQSPYTVSDLVNPRPNASSSFFTPHAASQFDRDMSVGSLLSRVEKRFADLLAGRLETGNIEPPVCRYINAMIALRSHTGQSAGIPQNKWVGLLEAIDQLWSSKLPKQSLSGSNFAGVLIAEMDVLKIAMDELIPVTSTSELTLDDAADDDRQTVDSNGADSNRQSYPSIDISSLDNDMSESLLKLSSRLVEWLHLSLDLLQSHSKGKAEISHYVLDGLLRGVSDGASYLDRIHPILRSRKLITETPASQENRFYPLGILVDLLSQPASTRPESITQLTEVLKTYSSLAPMLLQPLKKQDGSYLRSAFAFQDLTLNPPSSRRETLAIIVRYMMISAGYLADLLQELPECRPIFGDALELVFTLAEEGGGYEEPRRAIGFHVGEFVRVLEFFASDEANLELMTVLIANKLCILPIYPLVEGSHDYGLYVPPSCLPALIKAYPQSNLTPFSAQRLMEIIVNMLRSLDLSPSQLPPQTIPVPELQPSIKYLHQITRLPGAFSALAKAGAKNDDYAKAVAPGIAQISIIAANYDPKLTVSPVELQPPAVPGFLEAITWALPRLSAEEDEKTLYHQFIIAASVLLKVACRAQVSRDQIAKSSVRTTLLRELSEKKDACLEIISERKWHMLVNRLNLAEGGTELPDEESSDEESGSEVIVNLVPNEANEGDAGSEDGGENGGEDVLQAAPGP